MSKRTIILAVIGLVLFIAAVISALSDGKQNIEDRADLDNDEYQEPNEDKIVLPGKVVNIKKQPVKTEVIKENEPGDIVAAEGS